eukprot:GHVL01025124.1.p1 GENE.GHVL01025124.1~~GHVL01025124.1.p1  ORF type:complete len:140 (-),score=5.00 GHVL01025124.1:766-1185(-)
MFFTMSCQTNTNTIKQKNRPHGYATNSICHNPSATLNGNKMRTALKSHCISLTILSVFVKKNNDPWIVIRKKLSSCIRFEKNVQLLLKVLIPRYQKPCTREMNVYRCYRYHRISIYYDHRAIHDCTVPKILTRFKKYKK